MLTLFSVANFNFNTKNISMAADIQPQISGRSTIVEHSIFIHSPTYSVLYQRNLFFVDDFDNSLKVYNLNENKFSDSYLNLSTLGEIVDVAYSGEFLFVLSLDYENKLILTQIDLTTLQINVPIVLETTSNKYNKISVFDASDNWLISLTESADELENDVAFPIILTMSKTSNLIENYCLIEITDTDIISNIYELIIVKTTGITSNDVYMSIIYGGKIGFFGSTFESITENDSLVINSDSRSLLGDIDDDDDAQNVSISISSANAVTIDGETYFLITYTTTSTSIEVNSKLYKHSIDVSGSINNTFSKILDLPKETASAYTMTSNSCIVCPSVKNQSISYVELLLDEETNEPSYNKLPSISNPNVEVEYKNEVDFEYVTANKKTVLLSTPWESEANSTCIIDPTDSPKDLIVIGSGKITGENSLISDYKYCMFTTGDKNIKGYVKAEDLTEKVKISPENYDYKVFKVQPNTNLYSMPTTVINDNVTPTLTSYVISTINENSRVEVIDAICKYKSNEKIMLKVMINGNESQVGYIEYDKIIKPSEKVNYVITNASIKSNNTKVYESPDSSSSINFTLDKGYRVRINGSRNTETGYTSITFNDEYGNEFTGYILTDSLGSDSWTVMQIIGCVLIAINIGLLILILRFKHNSIGVNGSKYIDTENKSVKSKTTEN